MDLFVLRWWRRGTCIRTVATPLSFPAGHVPADRAPPRGQRTRAHLAQPVSFRTMGVRVKQMNPAAVTGQLLERGEELARIESALSEARAGRGTFVVIEGPAGIGKTALLATARTAAKSEGMRVLRSRGAELERD